MKGESRKSDHFNSEHWILNLCMFVINIKWILWGLEPDISKDFMIIGKKYITKKIFSKSLFHKLTACSHIPWNLFFSLLFKVMIMKQRREEAVLAFGLHAILLLVGCAFSLMSWIRDNILPSSSQASSQDRLEGWVSLNFH